MHRECNDHGVSQLPLPAPGEHAEQEHAADHGCCGDSRTLQRLHDLLPKQITRCLDVELIFTRIAMRLLHCVWQECGIPGSSAGVAVRVTGIQQAIAHHATGVLAARQPSTQGDAPRIYLLCFLHHQGHTAFATTVLHFVNNLLQGLAEAMPCAQQRQHHRLRWVQWRLIIIRVKKFLQILQADGSIVRCQHLVHTPAAVKHARCTSHLTLRMPAMSRLVAGLAVSKRDDISWHMSLLVVRNIGCG
mmetsp:Transcript_33229/g.83765  ORF Transcript_33229/g.83765 Transcript_33229/m.83765 type:complete len:246 (-) Transcript_33229:1054-1791(-)